MIHGGDVYTDGILKGKELIDYSSNINPLGIPQGFKENILKALDALTRYPDIQYRSLKEDLANYNNINKEYFILGNGAAEIIDLTISQEQSILIIAPSFGEYECSARKNNCKIIYSYLRETYIENIGYTLDYDYEDIMNKIKEVDAIVIGNPNNPNGEIIKKDKFIEVLSYCNDNKKRVIVDEAFIEFIGDMSKSLINYIEKYSCLVIIRALTKFYAMPGIRFGYGICSDKKYLEEIRKKQLPWNINTFAEFAVSEVLRDSDYINKSIKWIKEERKFFLTELKKIELFERVYETSGNFVLCKLRNLSDEKLYELTLQRGLLVRKCGSYEGLNNRYIRLAIKDRELNLKVLQIFKSIEGEV